MSYSIEECCHLFKIKDLRSCEPRDIKKSYHKLCLKHHPDKTTTKTKNSDFLKVRQCYEILLYHKAHEPVYEEEDDDAHIFGYILSLIDSNTIKIIETFLRHCRKNSVVNLHVSWNQVVSRDVYLHENIYIPLWFPVFHDENIFNIKVYDMPDNIKRMRNNDIVILQNYKLKRCRLNENISVSLSDDKVIMFRCSLKDIQERRHVFLNRGIPRVNTSDIYNIDELSHVIVIFNDE
jgi:hypothetical protein